MKAFAMLLMTAIVLSLTPLTPALADDKDKCTPFVEKLISGSPWHAQNTLLMTFKYDLVFFRDGRLKGKIENGNSPVSRNGEVRFLAVEFLKTRECAVSFESPSGADYNLGFDGDNLRGSVTLQTGDKYLMTSSR